MLSSFILFLIAFLLAIVGWFLPLDHYITPRNGAGYAMGIVGAVMMLLLFLYSLRKRWTRYFSWLGTASEILHFHISMGVYGPLLILFHSRFKLGAPNSNVALWSMIVVVLSGVMGRFMYHRVGWEKPFRLWHYAHLPFVGMMVMATLAHIFASIYY